MSKINGFNSSENVSSTSKAEIITPKDMLSPFKNGNPASDSEAKKNEFKNIGDFLKIKSAIFSKIYSNRNCRKRRL